MREKEIIPWGGTRGKSTSVALVACLGRIEEIARIVEFADNADLRKGARLSIEAMTREMRKILADAAAGERG